MILMIDFPPNNWLSNMKKESVPEITARNIQEKHKKSMKKD